MTAPHEQFRARQRHVTLPGLGPLELDMAYTDVGRGDPVVLLHGIPTWSFLYADAIPALADQCRVLAVDMLGHGWSDRRDRFDRSLRAQARAVLCLLDVLGIERATLVGHDTGGGVALILAVEHPDRVARLVLANAVAYDSWPVDDMIALGNPQWQDKSPGEIAAFVARGLPDGIAHPERLIAEFVDGIVAPWSDHEGAVSLIRNASALNTNHTMELVDRHSSSDDAAQIVGLIARRLGLGPGVRGGRAVEEFFVHPRDPYTRTDVPRTSRRVRVRVHDTMVAETGSADAAGWDVGAVVPAPWARAHRPA